MCTPAPDYREMAIALIEEAIRVLELAEHHLRHFHKPADVLEGLSSTIDAVRIAALALQMADKA
jgi:hypothetical protein